MNQQADALSIAADSRVEVVQSNGGTSLRELLPGARFFAGDDIAFTTVARAANGCTSGQLVVYRIGYDDPAELIAEALARGAAGILTEQLLPCPLPQCIVGDTDAALAKIRCGQLGRPDRRLLTIGVVGRAGKTTTALLIASLLRKCGHRTAYQTDLGECDGIVQTTSPMPLAVHTALIDQIDEAVAAESQVAVIELSDDSLRHGGYDAIEFDLLVVTGGSTGAVDYGPSVLQCGLDLVSSDGIVIAPADDRQTNQLIRDHGARQLTYSVRTAADVTAKLIDQSDGMSTLLITQRDTTAVMETSLCGAANAENHLAAVAVGLLIDEPIAVIAERLGALREVPGRSQRLAQHGSPTVVIEAGGTPERVAAALRAQRSMKGSGRLWSVFALDAGDSAECHARCGSLLERFADRVVVTAQPASKRQFLLASHSILDGVEDCAALRLVADRRRAIQWALDQARPEDTILIITGRISESALGQRSELEKISECVTATQQDRGQQRPPLQVFK